MARKKPARKKPSSEKPAEEKEDKMEAAETTPAGKKPSAEKRALSSNDGSSSGDKKKKSKKKSKQNYKPLILDALKEVYPCRGISRRSLTFLNDYANDFIEKVWQEADRIAEENSIDIITPRELDAAVYRIFPEDFAKGVVSEANRTYAKFLSDANQSGDGHEVAIQSGNPQDVAEV